MTTPLQFCLFTEPQQGATYDQLLAVARFAEDSGLDGFFRSDHYVPFSGDGRPGPSDAWTTLAGLARDTSRIRLGTLVSPATFRNPAVLALQVAQVDQMSAGRVELGLGAGWFEAEHEAFGLDFPATPERFDRFEEQLAIVTGIWAVPDGETYSFTGQHYRVSQLPGLPKPTQQRIPVIIGGGGKVRTPQLAARYATEFNIGFCPLDEASVTYERVRKACAEAGRDPASLLLSFAGPILVGNNEGELARRAQAAGTTVESCRVEGYVGAVTDIADQIARIAELGVRRFYLQVLDLTDEVHLQLVAEVVRSARG